MTLSATPKATLKTTVTSVPSRDLTYLVISDVHFFHRKTTTEFIIRNLDLFFEDYQPFAAMASMNAIFIAGDLFDQIGSTVDEIAAVLGWIHRLFDFAVKHNIVVRIMEGTRSHDCKQTKMFLPIALSYGSDLNFRYVDQLSIEFIPTMDLSVLYVPDEWLNSTIATEDVVDKLMASAGLETVDIAIMHGCFGFQIPQQKKLHLKHQESFYLPRVKYFINIGHDHTPKVNGRIIVQGSFDRLKHGEEHPKGGCICYLRTNGQHGYILAPNEKAKIYQRITVKSKDLETGLAYVRNKLKGIPDDSYIEIKARQDHPILQNIDLLRREYLYLNIEKAVETEDDEIVKAPILTSHEYTPIHIHKENICELVMDNVQNTHRLETSQHTQLETILKGLR